MAADDLDAFFDEVEEGEAEVVVSEEGKSNAKDEEGSAAEQPPAKRHKPNARPRGVVVAAAASSSSVPRPTATSDDKQMDGPTLGPTMMAQGSSFGPSLGASAQQHLPSLPPGVPPPPPPPPPLPPHNNTNAKPVVRMAAGQVWHDETLHEWPDNDYRIFVGNLPNDVTDQQLFQHFSKYPSVARAKVVRCKDEPEKSKGYGFVSLLDPLECAKAIREMDQSWLSSRPIRVKRSDWKDRDINVVRKKQRKEKKQQKRFGML